MSFKSKPRRHYVPSAVGSVALLTLVVLLGLSHHKLAVESQSSSGSYGFNHETRQQVLDPDNFIWQRPDGVTNGVLGFQGRRSITRFPYEDNRIDKRSEAPSVVTRKQQLAYLMSPMSDQVFEVGEALGGDNSIMNTLFEDRFRQMSDWPKLLAANFSPFASKSVDSSECHTIRSTVELTKDHIDKATGRATRSCKGSIQLNRCDGSCLSRVQPSVRSPDGFKKECNCCNEGTFRKIQVRLPECYSVIDNHRVIGGSMDIEVEEPVDCKCRRCESQL